MVRKLCYGLITGLIFCLPYGMYAQVGIGTVMPDRSAMLDVVSVNTGVLIPRVSLTGSMDVTSIANGNKESLLLYNTATVADIVPGYYYWADGKWNRIATTDTNGLVTAENGLTAVNGNARLGGELMVPTVITTSADNTLSIAGLKSGAVADDDIVVVDRNTGVLKKVIAAQLVQESQILIIAAEEQTEFTPPLPIMDVEKINVYRNGIRVDFTMVNTTTIKLESDAVCNQNDEIRIVQFY